MPCAQEMNNAIHDWVMDKSAWATHADMPELQGGGMPLKDMTKTAVYAIAKRMEIKGRSTMTKDELIKAIRAKAAALRRKAAKKTKPTPY